MKGSTIRYAAALLVFLVLALCLPASAMAESTTSTPSTGVVIATSPSENLSSITFSTANTKRIEVGKSTTLYVTTHNIASSATITFSSSDESIASIMEDGAGRCKVHGNKTGEVIITAKVGSMEASYLLYVGDESITAGGTVTTVASIAQTPGSIDYFSSTDESILQQYMAVKKSNDAVSYLIGVIGLAALIGLSGLVLSVMFRNRSPKLNLYPGSRRRFNTGVYHGNQRKRLLPDHYYRNNKRY